MVAMGVAEGLLEWEMRKRRENRGMVVEFWFGLADWAADTL